MPPTSTSAHLVMIKRITYEYRVVQGSPNDDHAIETAARGTGVVVQAPWRFTTEYKAKKIPDDMVPDILSGKKTVARPQVRAPRKTKGAAKRLKTG